MPIEGVTWISWPPISTGRVLGPLEVGEDDHELVAALARDGVHLAHARDQAPRDVLQDEVARVVAERVVHDLEAVEVQEQHRDVALLAARGHDRLVQAVLHEAPVGQPGERVVVRHVVDGALGVQALGDVLHQRGEAGDVALRVHERRVVPLAVDGAAVARHVHQRGLVALARFEELAAHRLHVLALGGRGEDRRDGLAEHLVGGEAEDRLGGRVPRRHVAAPVPLDHGERRALEMHAQLLRREELALLRLQPLGVLLDQRVVHLLQAAPLALELGGERLAGLARGERVDQRAVHARMHVGQDHREHQDHAREEHLVALARAPERHGERDEAQERGDLVRVAVRRVVGDGAGHEQHHQHHHREALHHAPGIGQEHRPERHPAQAREHRSHQEATLPSRHLLGRAGLANERLVEQVAPDAHQRHRDEPQEERRLREVLPEDRAEDEDHQERGEVTDQREPEEQPDLLRLERTVGGAGIRCRRRGPLRVGHSAPRRSGSSKGLRARAV
jgi:hypothetical protein